MTGREPFEGSDQPMDLTEIDRLCDVFEQRLRQGEALTIVQFLTELRIEGNPDLSWLVERLCCSLSSLRAVRKSSRAMTVI